MAYRYVSIKKGQSYHSQYFAGSLHEEEYGGFEGLFGKNIDINYTLIDNTRSSIISFKTKSHILKLGKEI